MIKGLKQTLQMITFVVISALTVPADHVFAQSNAMLVLDGSGSMWGQIEGHSKIVIARDVIDELLQDLSDDVHLGLAAYGHRRKGDCGDVEVLVSPSANSRDDIRTAVAGLKPKGKTPLASAVVKAARSMRHDEVPATVILISDGIETCAPDVCAVARDLEASGVDFTAHVIGFDVDEEEEAHTQFTCMAEATGGRYTAVNSALDLGAALAETAALTSGGASGSASQTGLPLVSTSGALYYSAEGKVAGELRHIPAHWEIRDADNSPILSGFQNAGGEIVLVPGVYQLKATDPETGHVEMRELKIRDGGTLQITLLFPPR